MTEKKTPANEVAALGAQCSAASDRSRSAGTVADFVHETDVLAALLDGGAQLSDASKRHLGVLVSNADELASLTEALAEKTTTLEKLIETKATWRMMLQLVASFKSLAQM